MRSTLSLLHDRLTADKDNLLQERPYGALTLADNAKLHDVYLREIYFRGKHRLTHKFFWIRNGLRALQVGLVASTVSTSLRFC